MVELVGLSDSRCMKDTKHSLPILRNGFATAVRKQRAKLDLTQGQLAEAMNVKRAYIGAVESCAVNVSLETAQRFRVALWPSAAISDLKLGLGQKVAEARSGRLTQESLSDRTHLSVPFISSVERGLSNTSLDQIEALANALHFDVLTWVGTEWFAFNKTELNDWLAALSCEDTERLPNSLRKKVCGELRSMRKNAGLTQDKLAAALGMTRSRISQIENAKSNITLGTLEQMASALTRTSTSKNSPSFVGKVGTRVAEIRKQKLLTQGQLGSQSGLGRTTISRIERADGATSLDHIEQISSALGVEPSVLIEGLYPLSKSPQEKKLLLRL